MGGTLTDDLDPVEGNVSSFPQGTPTEQDELNFPRQKSDDSDVNGGHLDGHCGLPRRTPQLESPGKGDTTGKILPSHI